jgi:hypothetical protein
MTINTKYDLYQRVYIKELKLWGLIKNIFIEDSLVQYNVRYLVSSEYKTCYFLESELLEQDDKVPIGLKV